MGHLARAAASASKFPDAASTRPAIAQASRATTSRRAWGLGSKGALAHARGVIRDAMALAFVLACGCQAARAPDARGAEAPGDGGAPSLADAGALAICSPWQGDGQGCEIECLHGVASSCMAAAFRLGQARGAAHDSARALSFYRRACDAGDASGCEQAARSIERGQGQRADDEERRALLDRACQLGAATACSTLLRRAPSDAPGDASSPPSRPALERACLAGNRAACEQIDGAPGPSPIVEPR